MARYYVQLVVYGCFRVLGMYVDDDDECFTLPLRLWTGQCMDREQARAMYNKALAEGQAPLNRCKMMIFGQVSHSLSPHAISLPPDS